MSFIQKNLSSTQRPYKFGILASGGGSNLNCLVAKDGVLRDAEFALLICNKHNASVLDLADRLNIPKKIIQPTFFDSREDFDLTIAKEFWAAGVEFILLCGYTTTITLPLIKTYENRIINIHPSLLPAFGGKGMFGMNVHRAALNRGVKIAGCTVHLVNENLDEGAILAQSCLQVEVQDTPESLQKRIFELEEQIYPSTVAQYIETLPRLNFNKLPYAFDGKLAGVKQPDYFDDERKDFLYELPEYNRVAYGLCDTGLQRQENADTILISQDLQMLAVADGIGSAKEGKQTSRMVISYIEKKWNEEKLNRSERLIDYPNWLRSAVTEANRQILNWAERSMNRVDIGSTLTTALFDFRSNSVYISNTGDSRAYLWRSNTLYLLTKDHVTETIGGKDSQSGGLLYYIGGLTGSFNVDIFHVRIYPKDRFLLCSDGLLYVSESKLVKELEAGRPPKETAQRLLELTYEAQAPDNTSIIVYDY